MCPVTRGGLGDLLGTASVASGAAEPRGGCGVAGLAPDWESGTRLSFLLLDKPVASLFCVLGIITDSPSWLTVSLWG